MRPRTATLGLAVAATIVVLALPAFSGTTSLEDPNDTSGRLDIRRVGLDATVSPAWRIVVFRPWTIREIWDSGFVMVQLDTKGDARIDHLAVVNSNGRDLIGTLNRVRAHGRLAEIGRFRVSKDGGRALTLTIALHRLSIGAHRTSYSWNVVTSFLGDTCPRTCFDVVPNTGMVEQPLPTPSPSPTGPSGPSG